MTIRFVWYLTMESFLIFFGGMLGHADRTATKSWCSLSIRLLSGGQESWRKLN